MRHGATSSSPLDKAWIRRSFDRASSTYDSAAVLQSEVRDVLLERLDLTDLSPQVVVDLGAGTGHACRALKRRYPAAQIIALDSSLGMLRAAARQQSWLRPFQRLCADAESLPLPDGRVDLILSNFMLPWSDPDAVFAECRRVLAPRGLLSFTTLGPDTLMELRAAWFHSRPDARSAAPDADLEVRVMPFMDMHDIGDALVRAGFAAPVLDVERYTLRYTEVRQLAADLKATGARNAATLRPKGFTGSRRFAAMQSVYEQCRDNGRLPATYEVVFGQAWSPVTRAPPGAGSGAGAGSGPGSGSGSVEVSLEDLRRELEKRRGS